MGSERLLDGLVASFDTATPDGAVPDGPAPVRDSSTPDRAPPDTALAGGPALYWNFDESSGTQALDASGNGFHGTHIGQSGIPAPSALVPSLVFPNPFSRAFMMAARHAVVLSGMPALLKPATEVTIAAWYRATSLDEGLNRTGASDLVSAGNSYLIRIDGNRVVFVKRVAGRWAGCYGQAQSALDGRWHHFAGVNSAAGMKTYFDGVERCSNNETQPIAYDQSSDFYVGRHANNEDNWDFGGNLDEIRVYTRALSAADIARLAAGARD
jgi:hypothetical protein